MNVYLDTNIILQDPFFESFLGNLLLDRAIEGLIKIYIPEIVLLEVKFNYINRIEILESDIKSKAIELFKLYGNDIDIQFIDKIIIKGKIDSFYDEKYAKNIFQILENNLDQFKKTLKKSINHDAPFFFDKKKEFKDSLIWDSIINSANKYTSEENYFISNNFNDFWNKEKSDFHLVLKSEVNNLIILESYKSLFDKVKDLQDWKKHKEFEQWFESQDITNEKISEASDKYLWNNIISVILNKLRSYQINLLYPENEIGFIEPFVEKQNLIFEKISNIDLKGSYADIEVTSRLNFIGKIHFPNYEKRDLSTIVTSWFKADFKIHLSYDREEIFRFIEIDLTNLQKSENN